MLNGTLDTIESKDYSVMTRDWEPGRDRTVIFAKDGEGTPDLVMYFWWDFDWSNYLTSRPSNSPSSNYIYDDKTSLLAFTQTHTTVMLFLFKINIHNIF